LKQQLPNRDRLILTDELEFRPEPRCTAVPAPDEHQHKIQRITLNDLMVMAKRFCVAGASDALAWVREAMGQWMGFADAARLEEDEARAKVPAHGT
jgi:hypothetical protein